MKNRFNIYKKSFPVLVSVVLLVCLLIPSNYVSAVGLADAFTSLTNLDAWGMLANLIGGLFRYIFLNLAEVVVLVGAYMVDVFLDPSLYQAVLTSDAIDTGWRTVRDFCNMFYVFFLLLIAFSTITGNQAYSAKSLLPKVIISLFLINFSMVIAKIVIDFGQVFLFGMAGWMGNFSGADGAVASLTSIVDYFQAQFKDDGNPTATTLILIILASGYSFLLGILYMVLACFLLARLLSFVILIVVSPFAFFSMVLPSMRTYSSKWWRSLFNNAISGPVFIFFVYLSSMFARELYVFNSPVAKSNLGFMASMLDLFIPHLIAMGLLYAAIPATQTLSAAGSKQILGGTMGIGKVAMGAYAGYKIGEKAVTGTASRANAEFKRSAKYNKLTENVGNRLANTKVPFVAGAYLKTEANRAQQHEVRVKAQMDAMKNFTPERMDALVRSKIDTRSKAETKEAMHRVLLEKQKTTDTDYMKAGYKTKGVSGEDVLNETKLRNDLKIIKNYGGDISDVYKQRVDFADKADIEKEINKSIEKGEFNKQKLDILLNPDVLAAVEKNIPKDQFDKWIKSKSAGEIISFMDKKERELAVKLSSGALTLGSKEIENFREMSALLSSATDKQRRLAQIDARVPVVNNRLNYMKDSGTPAGAPPTYTQNIDIELADKTLNKISKSDLLNLDETFLGKNGHLLSQGNIKYLGERGEEVQIAAVRKALDDVLSGSRPMTEIPRSLQTSTGVIDIAKVGKRKKQAERTA